MKIKSFITGLLLMLAMMMLPVRARADVIDEPIPSKLSGDFIMFLIITVAVAVIVVISLVVLHIERKNDYKK